MIHPGQLLSERGDRVAERREINRLKRIVLALRPMPGTGTDVFATKIGTAHNAKVGTRKGSTTGRQSMVARWG